MTRTPLDDKAKDLAGDLKQLLSEPGTEAQEIATLLDRYLEHFLARRGNLADKPGEGGGCGCDH